jgi:hypothetical protein
MNEKTQEKSIAKHEILSITFGKLSPETVAEIDAFVDSMDYGKNASAYFVHKMITRQRILFRGNPKRGEKINPKECLLIRLRDALLVGSGWCEKCDGALGRGEY